MTLVSRDRFALSTHVQFLFSLINRFKYFSAIFFQVLAGNSFINFLAP